MEPDYMRMVQLHKYLYFNPEHLLQLLLFYEHLLLELIAEEYLYCLNHVNITNTRFVSLAIFTTP